MKFPVRSRMPLSNTQRHQRIMLFGHIEFLNIDSRYCLQKMFLSCLNLLCKPKFARWMWIPGSTGNNLIYPQRREVSTFCYLGRVRLTAGVRPPIHNGQNHLGLHCARIFLRRLTWHDACGGKHWEGRIGDQRPESRPERCLQRA